MMYIIQWNQLHFEDLGDISVFMCSLKSPPAIRTENRVFHLYHLYSMIRSVLSQENGSTGELYTT